MSSKLFLLTSVGYFIGLVSCGISRIGLHLALKKRKMRNSLSVWIRIKSFFRKKSTQKILIFYIIPLVIGYIMFIGIVSMEQQYRNQEKLNALKDSFDFIWNVVILGLVIGTLVLNLKINKRKMSDREIEIIGFFIIISSMIILFGLMFQGYYFLQYQKYPVYVQLGERLSTIGGWLLFSSFVALFFRIIEKLINSYKT